MSAQVQFVKVSEHFTVARGYGLICELLGYGVWFKIIILKNAKFYDLIQYLFHEYEY